MATVSYIHVDPTAGATCRMGFRFQLFQMSQTPLKVCDACGKPVKEAPPVPKVVNGSEHLDPLSRAAWLYGNKAFDTPKEPPGANQPSTPPDLPKTGSGGPLVG